MISNSNTTIIIIGLSYYYYWLHNAIAFDRIIREIIILIRIMMMMIIMITYVLFNFLFVLKALVKTTHLISLYVGMSARIKIDALLCVVAIYILLCGKGERGLELGRESKCQKQFVIFNCIRYSNVWNDLQSPLI